MFKFFPDENNGDNATDKTSQDKVYRECKELLINDFHFKLARGVHNKTPCAKLTDKVLLKYVNLADLINEGVDEDVAKILNSSSDLDSGVYEGGFKTWECTWDLVNYIQNNFSEFLLKHSSDGTPIKVLDLGCGSGLLGLAVLKMAEENGIDVRVDFQDYNEEVINHVTIPNTLLNFDDEKASKCRFYSGDWGSFNEHLVQTKFTYDLMLSSETIYNLEYFQRFIDVIRNGLRTNGSMFLAAKTFYFGVGGGTRSFLDKVNQQQQQLDGQVVCAIKEGVHREIIRVRKK